MFFLLLTIRFLHLQVLQAMRFNNFLNFKLDMLDAPIVQKIQTNLLLLTNDLFIGKD